MNYRPKFDLGATTVGLLLKTQKHLIIRACNFEFSLTTCEHIKLTGDTTITIL